MENIIHILLIEDDEDDHFFVSEMLSEIDTWQADLDWASSVESAFEKIQHNSYDLFLLDYNLGKYSGLDFIARLPKHQKQTPVVMLTGERERSRDMAEMQAGAMDYLIKGRIDADRLERSIRYALARKKVERQKDDFVATVNHELRTPITSIKGSLGIALHAYGEAIPEEVHEMLEVALRNCERLIRIVNDLLDVHKVQSGKL
jgi:DNA-binding response OmpR family regulator